MLLPNNGDLTSEDCSTIMILTCPACQTKYVVKDGAIPVGGRQVRCASCKHSWHQDPDESAVETEAEVSRDPQFDVEPEARVEEAVAAIVDQPAFPTTDMANPLDQIATEAPPAPLPPSSITDDRQWQKVEPASAWDDPTPEPAAQTPTEPATEEFEPFYDHEPIEQPKRKWPIVLLLILLVALAAIAFWFLAPADLRARAGLASNGSSKLDVVLNTNDYQRLASGNSLFTLSGRIVNSTDSRQQVPPIRAELLDESKQKVIYSWTISPPVASLDLNKSAPFNSAEVDVPEGGKYIRLRLGGPV
ncbi:MAG: zinc-ribbon domain-containing protein [Pseudomonadota bacterium]